MRRRDFMRAAGGATVVTAATAGATGSVAGTAAEEEGEDSSGGSVEPDFGPYLDDARGFETTEDLREQDEVTIEVGAGSDGLSFDPAGVWISPGTTIIWEWTGEGGSHNVVANEGPAGIDSGDPVSEEGSTYEYEFAEEDAGITTYKCEPHEGQGMKGGVAVGDDVETISAGGSELKEPIHFGVDIHEHWVGVTVVVMLLASLIFTFFMLKYGESAHTSGGT
jgi:halocyanin-like protein